MVMAEKQTLDEILQGYDQKKAAELAKNNAAATALNEKLDQFKSFRYSTMLPLMEKIKHRLISAGHYADITTEDGLPGEFDTIFIEFKVQPEGNSGKTPCAIFFVSKRSGRTGYKFFVHDRPFSVNFSELAGSPEIVQTENDVNDILLSFLALVFNR